MTEPEVKLEIPAMTWEYRGEGLYICWSNRFHCGAKEDLAMFMWPFHAPEDTAAVECLYESIADFMVNAQRRLSAAEAERDALKAEFDDCVKHLIFLQPAQSADEWGEPIWRLVKPRMGALKAELATARQTIERLSAPVSDEEWITAIQSTFTARSFADRLIAARKDANDKEKA
jgi:hypothetical protein